MIVEFKNESKNESKNEVYLDCSCELTAEEYFKL